VKKDVIIVDFNFPETDRDLYITLLIRVMVTSFS